MSKRKDQMKMKEMADEAYWQRLADKYFDALTTEEEERALKAYVVALPEEDTSMDDVKAVMGYAVVGRRLEASEHQQARPDNFLYRRWAAACLLLVLGLARLYYAQNNFCVAYIDGKEYTDTEFVMKQMQYSMDEIGLNDRSLPSAEHVLNDLFGSMDEADVIITRNNE